MSGAAVSEWMIRIAADTAQLRSQLDAAVKHFTGASLSMEGALGLVKTAAIGLSGALTIGAISGFVKSAIEANGALHDLSITTGMSAAALQQFKSVGSYTNTSLETITGSALRMSKGLASATEDSKGAATAIKALGLNVEQFKKLSPEQQMLEIAKAMGQFEDGSGKSAAAMMLFGKQGAQLLPFLADLAESADQVNGKLSEQEIAARKATAAMADAYGDNMTKISKQSNAWKKDIGEGLIPVMYEASEAFLRVANGVGGIKEQISKLAKDGTLAEWGRGAITVFTYFIDVGQGLLSIIPMIGKAIAGVAAATSVTFGAIAQAFDQIKAGNFSGAWDSLKSGVAGVREVAVMAGQDISEIWGQKLLGQTFRERMADLKGMGVTAKEARPELKLTAKEAGEADKEYGKLVASIKEHIEALQFENTSGEKVAESQKLAIKIKNDLANGTLKLTTAQREYVDGLIKEYAAAEKEHAAQKEAAKIAEEVRKAKEKAGQDAQREADKMAERVNRQLEENEAIGKTKQEIEQLEIARLRHERAILQEQVAIEDSLGVCTAETEAHKATLAALNDLIVAREQGVQLKAAQETKDAWLDMAKSMENALTDSLMRGFDSGKSMALSLRDYVVNAFKGLVVKIGVQGIMGMVGSLVPGLASATGSAGGGGLLGSLMGGGASSGLSSLWGAVTDTVMGGGSSIFSALGSSALLGGTSFGAGLSYVGANGILGGLASAPTFAAAGEGMLALGAALPAIGIALAAIPALASAFGHGGTPHQGGIAFSNGSTIDMPTTRDATASRFASGWNTAGAGIFHENDWHSRNQAEVSSALGDAAKGAAAWFNSITGRYGAGNGYSVGLAYSADNEDPSRGRFGVITSSGQVIGSAANRYDKDAQQGMQEFSDDLPRLLVKALRDVNLDPVIDAWLDSAMTSTGDALDGLSRGQSEAVLTALQQGWLDDLLSIADTAGVAFDDVLGVVEQMAAMPGADKLLGIIKKMDVSWDVLAEGMASIPDGVIALAGVLQAMDALPDVFETVEQAGMSVAEKYRYQTDALNELIANFDGSTEQAAQIAQLVQSRYQTEIEYLTAIRQMVANITASAKQQGDSFLLDTLDVAGRQAYYNTEMQQARDMIAASHDPAVIEAQYQRFARAQASAWNNLSDDEKRLLLPSFQADLNDIAALATGQGGDVSTLIGAENQSIETRITNAIEAALQGVFDDAANRIANAASSMNNAADTMQDAANTPVSVSISLDNYVRAPSETVYFGGGT